MCQVLLVTLHSFSYSCIIVWCLYLPECNCHGKSEECYYNQTVADAKLSLNIHGEYEGGGVCLGCSENTGGINCQSCVDGYYRPTEVSFFILFMYIYTAYIYQQHFVRLFAYFLYCCVLNYSKTQDFQGLTLPCILLRKAKCPISDFNFMATWTVGSTLLKGWRDNQMVFVLSVIDHHNVNISPAASRRTLALQTLLMWPERFTALCMCSRWESGHRRYNTTPHKIQQ